MKITKYSQLRDGMPIKGRYNGEEFSGFVGIGIDGKVWIGKNRDNRDYWLSNEGSDSVFWDSKIKNLETVPKTLENIDSLEVGDKIRHIGGMDIKEILAICGKVIYLEDDEKWHTPSFFVRYSWKVVAEEPEEKTEVTEEDWDILLDTLVVVLDNYGKLNIRDLDSVRKLTEKLKLVDVDKLKIKKE